MYETQSRYGSLQRPYKFAPEKNTTLWSEWVGDFDLLRDWRLGAATLAHNQVQCSKVKNARDLKNFE